MESQEMFEIKLKEKARQDTDFWKLFSECLLSQYSFEQAYEYMRNNYYKNLTDYYGGIK